MKIHPIENIIIECLEASKDITLPTLGGVRALYDEINNLKTSPYISEITGIIAKEIALVHGEDWQKCQEILLIIIGSCNDEFGINEIIENIERVVEHNNRLEEPYLSTLIEQSNNTEKKPLVRAWLLEAAFRTSLVNSKKRFALLAHLVDININDDGIFLLHASKILGLAYSNWAEAELVEKLEQIKSSNIRLGEVWFELGMCYLYDALSSKDKERALFNFRSSKFHFEKSIELDIERPDGVAYRAALEILLTFSEPNTGTNIQPLAHKIYEAITIYYAWHAPLNKTTWSNARNTELVNWYLLSNKLEKLSHYLTEPSWLNPVDVIEEYLVKVYSASRAILKKNSSGGLEKVIQPQIESQIFEQEDKRYLLKQWSVVVDETKNRKFAQSVIRKLVNCQDSEVQNIINSLSPQKKSNFDRFVIDYRNLRTNSISIKIEQIFESITAALLSVSDYKNNGDIKRFFEIILFNSLRFLESRMDSSKTNHSDLAYLFEQKTPPLERELQKDYHQYMLSALMEGNTSIEKSDVASGRVDVYFSSTKFNIAAEVKRDWQDCSFSALREKYIGQASEYSNTDVKLGFLLVLDLTTKPHGVKSIEQCVHVEIVEKKGDPVKRGVVVIVVPGMRKTPSSIKLEA